MISFTARTKDFKNALSLMRVVHKRKRLHNIHATCEITLVDSYVRLSIPGASFGFNCQSKGTAKATLSFSQLFSIVDHHSIEDIYVEFFDGSLRIGLIKIESKTVFFKTDAVLRTIILTDKYSDLDLLLLKNEGYTPEELAFNNLVELIEAAERRVYYNVRKSASYLKEYGLMPKEIKQLLVEKLGIKLDLDEKDVKLLLAKD